MEHHNDIGIIYFYCNRVRWVIPSFYSLPQKVNTVIESPRFHFARKLWKMFVYPNGCSWDSSSGWLGIGVRNESFYCGSAEKLIVRLSIASKSKSHRYVTSSQVISDDNGNYYRLKLIPCTLLESLKDSMVSEGKLHLIFTIEEESESVQSAVASSTAQGGKERGARKLQTDLKEFLLSENLSDITIKIKNKEFKAHRNILAARSPVFLAMMMHDTKEKNTGIVNIKDTDPDTFSDFLLYLYTGSTEQLTSKNMQNLYIIADKYQVNELKNDCLKCMLRNISVENFCEVFAISLRYDEKDLTDGCVHFFVENSMEIVMSTKWKRFLTENPIVGNELFIRHLQMSEL